MATETKRIKCAHCKEYHGSIDEVKACAAVHNAAQVFATPPSPMPDGPTWCCKMFSLGHGHGHHRNCEKFVPPAQPASVTLRQIAKRDAVPAGRYAIVDRNDHDKIYFYRVSRPTEGRWAGRVFVERQVSDDYIPLKSTMSRNMALDKIALDPQEAMLRYGREIGSCGHCGRTLTNEESRAVGIGPICRSRMGW